MILIVLLIYSKKEYEQKIIDSKFNKTEFTIKFFNFYLKKNKLLKGEHKGSKSYNLLIPNN